MTIQKRTLPMYIFLNCITLGIYGFVVAKQMNDEINALCNGDGQEPAVGYVAAVFIRLIPIFGPLYFNYWWYQQANRLKLNANRYDLDVKESGTDVFLMRTVLEVPLAAITTLEIGLAWLVPGVVTLLFTLIHPVIGVIFGGIFAIIFGIFSAELTVGANISNYYMMKNLNRFADVYRNGAKPFDPMAYEYYPSINNNYPARFNGVVENKVIVDRDRKDEEEIINHTAKGALLGVMGTCAGYTFDLSSGEEIVIGKDARMSSVVIDPAYKEVSRKHVGVRFDPMRDQYIVIDYSSNGTLLNGSKLEKILPTYASHGAELKLANGKNIFRLV